MARFFCMTVSLPLVREHVLARRSDDHRVLTLPRRYPGMDRVHFAGAGPDRAPEAQRRLRAMTQ